MAQDTIELPDPGNTTGYGKRVDHPRDDRHLRDVDLTDDDIALLACMADGATLRDVARRLHISHRTASRRVSEICAVLGVTRPIQAVAWAARRGLV